MLLRRLLVVISVLLAGSAWALTPGQRALLFSGIKPVFQTDLTQGALPSQISFSRASNATLFDSTGKLTYAPNNQITQSNTYSDASWTKTNVTLTSGVADPLGGTSAWTMTATGANAEVFKSVAGNNATNYVSAVWMRRRTGTGTIQLTNPAGSVQSVVLTSSWQQLSKNGPGAVSNLVFSDVIIVTSGDAIDIYASTLSAVTYETAPRLQDQVITTSSAYFGPRFDYNPSTLAPLGLLIEEQRTNVVLQNRNLSNASWTKTNVTAAQDQTGIDGVANSASSILATAGNGTVLQAITLASSQRFQTAYVQRITGTGVVNMTTDGGATWTAITVPGAGTWGRVSIPAQTVTNPSVGFQLVTNTDKIKVDFVQNETGPFATSAIATTTTSVIRSADLPSSTNAILLAARAWIVETGEMQAATAATVLGINTGIGLGETAANALTTAYGGAQTTANTATWTGTNRAGIAFDTSPRVSLVLNGGTVVTAANATSVPANLYFGNTNNGASAFMNGHLRKLCAYAAANDNFLAAKSVVGVAC